MLTCVISKLTNVTTDSRYMTFLAKLFLQSSLQIPLRRLMTKELSNPLLTTYNHSHCLFYSLSKIHCHKWQHILKFNPIMTQQN